MDNQFELQRLLRRQDEIRHAMRQPGGIRVTVERELYAIDELLKQYPNAQHTIPSASRDNSDPRR